MFNHIADHLQRTWVSVGVGVVSLAAGLIGKSKATKAANAALAQRTPYKTPKELIDIVNSYKALGQTGLDPFSLNFAKNQNEMALSNTLGSAERLGADPNLLGQIFDRNLTETGRITAANHSAYMDNFLRSLNAQQYLVQSKDAEWASREGLIKDKQQAAEAQRLAAGQTINSGINSIIAGASNYAIGKLYADHTGNTDNIDLSKLSKIKADPQLIRSGDYTVLQPGMDTQKITQQGAKIRALLNSGTTFDSLGNGSYRDAFGNVF